MFLLVSRLPLLILLLHASSIAADSLHIPLSRRAPTTEWTMDNIHAHGDYIRAKYGYKTPDNRRAASDIPMTNQVTASHYSAPSIVISHCVYTVSRCAVLRPSDHWDTVSVSSESSDPRRLDHPRVLRCRSQQVNVYLDTGSADLWVGPSFNPTASITYAPSNQQLSIPYESSQVTGTIASDRVTMGGFTVPIQHFRVYSLFFPSLFLLSLLFLTPRHSLPCFLLLTSSLMALSH